jgi:hypothetical protein
MKLYGAIDLHSNNNVTVLSDEQDRVVYEKRLPNDLSLIAEQLATYRDSIQGIVVESTYNWYWLVDGLMDEGHKIHLANTAAIQQYEGLQYGWEFYPKDIFIQSNIDPYAICCASADRWCGKEP